jgi:hypothetical protein
MVASRMAAHCPQMLNVCMVCCVLMVWYRLAMVRHRPTPKKKGYMRGAGTKSQFEALIGPTPIQWRDVSYMTLPRAASPLSAAPPTPTPSMTSKRRLSEEEAAAMDVPPGYMVPLVTAGPKGKGPAKSRGGGGAVRRPRKRCCQAWFDYATGKVIQNKRCNAIIKRAKGQPYAGKVKGPPRPASARQIAHRAFVAQFMAGAPTGEGSGPERKEWMRRAGAAWVAKHGVSTKSGIAGAPRSLQGILAAGRNPYA